MTNSHDLIERIRESFRDVSREDGITLHEATVIDDYGSPEDRLKARAFDTESTWEGVPDSDIAHHYTIFSFLDAKGFRYYLPAYMVWTLKNFDRSDSDTVDFVIYALVVSGPMGTERRKYFESLSQSQREVVCQFLRFMSAHPMEVDAKVADDALEEYWAQFCPTYG